MNNSNFKDYFGLTPEQSALKKLAEYDKEYDLFSDIEEVIEQDPYTDYSEDIAWFISDVIAEIYEMSIPEYLCIEGYSNLENLKYYYGMKYLYNTIKNRKNINPYYSNTDFSASASPQEFYDTVTNKYNDPKFINDMMDCYGENYTWWKRTEIMTLINELENTWESITKKVREHSKTYDDLHDVELWV